MTPKQEQGYVHYWKLAKSAIKAKSYKQAMDYLGCCHILSKNAYFPHLRIHITMLKIGLVSGNLKEVRVQLFRSFMAFATIPILAGTTPNGNPGTAEHGFFDKCEIPPALKEYF